MKFIIGLPLCRDMLAAGQGCSQDRVVKEGHGACDVPCGGFRSSY